ncbi:hypothetical protein GCM10020258_32780 [Sphingomonas yabuuchiae]
MLNKSAADQGPDPVAGNPLDKCRVFGSSDVDETRAQVARLYCDHRLNPVSPNARLQAWQNAVTLKQSCLATMGYGAEVQIDPGKLKDFYLLMLPYAGEAMVDAGGRMVQASSTLGTLLSPDDLVTMRWSPDCAKYMVRIDRAALEQHVASLLGHPLRRPLNFRLAIPREGLGAEWWRLAELLVGLVECQDRAHPQNLAIDQLEQALLFSLIEGRSIITATRCATATARSRPSMSGWSNIISRNMPPIRSRSNSWWRSAASAGGRCSTGSSASATPRRWRICAPAGCAGCAKRC